MSDHPEGHRQLADAAAPRDCEWKAEDPQVESILKKVCMVVKNFQNKVDKLVPSFTVLYIPNSLGTTYLTSVLFPLNFSPSFLDYRLVGFRCL